MILAGATAAGIAVHAAASAAKHRDKDKKADGHE
jgi:hypothetical protein